MPSSGQSLTRPAGSLSCADCQRNLPVVGVEAHQDCRGRRSSFGLRGAFVVGADEDLAAGDDRAAVGSASRAAASTSMLAPVSGSHFAGRPFSAEAMLREGRRRTWRMRLPRGRLGALRRLSGLAARVPAEHGDRRFLGSDGHRQRRQRQHRGGGDRSDVIPSHPSRSSPSPAGCRSRSPPPSSRRCPGLPWRTGCGSSAVIVHSSRLGLAAPPHLAAHERLVPLLVDPELHRVPDVRLPRERHRLLQRSSEARSGAGSSGGRPSGPGVAAVDQPEVGALPPLARCPAGRPGWCSWRAPAARAGRRSGRPAAAAASTAPCRRPTSATGNLAAAPIHQGGLAAPRRRLEVVAPGQRRVDPHPRRRAPARRPSPPPCRPGGCAGRRGEAAVGERCRPDPRAPRWRRGAASGRPWASKALTGKRTVSPGAIRTSAGTTWSSVAAAAPGGRAPRRRARPARPWSP